MYTSYPNLFIGLYSLYTYVFHSLYTEYFTILATVKEKPLREMRNGLVLSGFLSFYRSLHCFPEGNVCSVCIKSRVIFAFTEARLRRSAFTLSGAVEHYFASLCTLFPTAKDIFKLFLCLRIWLRLILILLLGSRTGTHSSTSLLLFQKISHRSP